MGYRFLPARNRKFESISLQRRVNKLSVPFALSRWHYLALGVELPEPGDFRTTKIGDTPVIVTRAVPFSGKSDGYLSLKFTIAVPHPTPSIQRFCNPSLSRAMSVADTIILAVNDSSLASPAR